MKDTSLRSFQTFLNIQRKVGKTIAKHLKLLKKTIKLILKLNKKRFDCETLNTEDIINARKVLHWLELGNEILDCHICLFSKSLNSQQVQGIVLAV